MKEQKLPTKKISFGIDEKFVPLILFFFTFLTYAPLISQIGFYWDDWPMLWFKITQGAEGFAEAFTSDRPFLGNLYQATAEILGDAPLQWQALTIFMRWAVSIAFWWMLKQLWPKQSEYVFWITLMATVYSGFKQMPIAYLWANALIMLFAYVLSYGMMLKAIRSSSRKAYVLWTIPSVLCYTFCTISTEYYTGLDIARGAILLVFFAGTTSFTILPFWKKILQILKHWAPYLIVLAIFMFWRVFIFQFPSYKPVFLTQLAHNPINAIFDLIVRIIEDAYTATWGSWTEFFKFPNHTDFSTNEGILFWVFTAAGLVFCLFFVFILRWKKESISQQNNTTRKLRWTWEALLLGLFMVICPGFPYWITTLNIRLTYPYDRFLIAFLFGSAIFMTALIDLLLRTKAQKNIVFSLFVAMAIGGNILNANNFRKDWNMQKEFVDQLVTRIPSLEQPTMLLTNSNPFTYESDNSLTGLVNLALAPEHNNLNIPYAVNQYSIRFKTMDAITEPAALYEDFRSALFSVRSDQIIVYFYSPPGCLRILDQDQHSKLPIFPKSYYEIMPLSRPERIQDNGESSTFLQDNIFKEPITENWCYYFEKADLARQSSDWTKIAAIGDEALKKYSSSEPSEYIPFVEAYAYMDRWEDAVALAQRIHNEDKNLDQALCSVLHDLIFYATPDIGELDSIQQKINSVGCSAYGSEDD